MKRRIIFCFFILMTLIPRLNAADAQKPQDQDEDAWAAPADWEEAGQDIRELFERLLAKQAGGLRRSAGRGIHALSGPAVDLKTTPQELIVECEVPGWDKKDISVELVNQTLVIRGRKSGQAQEAAGDYYARERWSGDFERRIALPVPVLADQVRAEQANGVLVIHLARQSEEKPVKVQIA